VRKTHATLLPSSVVLVASGCNDCNRATYVIAVAAVADYRAKEIAPNKIKKTSADEISIDLVKNPDILKEISSNKKGNQLVIGFCAESENLLEYAKDKTDIKLKKNKTK